jgi:hypothetical protein
MHRYKDAVMAVADVEASAVASAYLVSELMK